MHAFTHNLFKNGKIAQIMKAVLTTALTACFIFVSFAIHAGQIDGIRMWSSPDGTRLVFDISAPIEHQVFVLHNPDRIVVDFKNTSFREFSIIILDHENIFKE